MAWSYDPSLGQWTWVAGSNTIEAVGVYGALGVAGASNSPGGRVGGMSLIDSGGHLWLFGGYAYDVNYDRAEWKY